MSLPVQIRSAHAEDLDAMMLIRNAAVAAGWSGVYPENVIAAQQNMPVKTQDDLNYLIAECDGDAVGYFCGRGSLLDELYVLPDAGRQGVGRQLIDAWQAERLEDGVVWFYVCASYNAVSFYQKLGFEEVGEGESSQGVAYKEMQKFLL